MKKNIYLLILTSIFITIFAQAQFGDQPDPTRPATSASDTAGVASGILVQPTVPPTDTINNVFPDNQMQNKGLLIVTPLPANTSPVTLPLPGGQQ